MHNGQCDRTCVRCARSCATCADRHTYMHIYIYIYKYHGILNRTRLLALICSVFPIHFICDVLLAELVQTYFTIVSSLTFSLIVRSTVVEVLSSKRLRASLLVTYRRTCVCIMFTVFLQHITVYNFYCVGHTHVYCMYGGVN